MSCVPIADFLPPPDKSSSHGVAGVAGVTASRKQRVSVGSISSTGSESESQGSERPLLKSSSAEEKKFFRKKKVTCTGLPNMG